jgi:hypothetical protein
MPVPGIALAMLQSGRLTSATLPARRPLPWCGLRPFAGWRPARQQHMQLCDRSSLAADDVYLSGLRQLGHGAVGGAGRDAVAGPQVLKRGRWSPALRAPHLMAARRSAAIRRYGAESSVTGGGAMTRSPS